MKNYRLAVVIMRAQLPTNAHFSLIDAAHEAADHVLVLLGSSNKAPSFKNPFSFKQRRSMLQAGMSPRQLMYTGFTALKDMPTDFDWEEQVLCSINRTKTSLGIVKDSDVTLVAHEKDDSSYYVHNFPQLKLTLTPSFGEYNATDARKRLVTGQSLDGYTPSPVINWIEKEYKAKPAEAFGFDWLVNEYKAAEAFKKVYAGLPHGVNFVTGDALVVCGSHILLVQRSGKTGHNQWALPGGFKEPGEGIKACIERELREETVIDVPPRALRMAFKGIDPFHAPDRDPRGDFTTFCGVYVLEANTDGTLPRVKGSSDAKQAIWKHIAEIKEMSRYMFADHATIIETQMRKYL